MGQKPTWGCGTSGFKGTIGKLPVVCVLVHSFVKSLLACLASCSHTDAVIIKLSLFVRMRLIKCHRTLYTCLADLCIERERTGW